VRNDYGQPSFYETLTGLVATGRRVFIFLTGQQKKAGQEKKWGEPVLNGILTGLVATGRRVI
jgi:hypothetical protein